MLHAFEDAQSIANMLYVEALKVFSDFIVRGPLLFPHQIIGVCNSEIRGDDLENIKIRLALRSDVCRDRKLTTFAQAPL